MMCCGGSSQGSSPSFGGIDVEQKKPLSERTCFKVSCFGESGCGKTSLVRAFVLDEFRENVEATIGGAFLAKGLQTPEGRDIKLEIWDTAGQEKYRSLAPMYYRNSDFILLVFDITSRSSFEHLRTWEAEFSQEKQNAFYIIVGTKIDMGDSRHISTEEGLSFRDSSLFWDCGSGCEYFEASAKTRVGVGEVFDCMAQVTEGRFNSHRPGKTIKPARKS